MEGEFATIVQAWLSATEVLRPGGRLYDLEARREAESLTRIGYVTLASPEISTRQGVAEWLRHRAACAVVVPAGRAVEAARTCTARSRGTRDDAAYEIPPGLTTIEIV
jgi:hypothetical protein